MSADALVRNYAVKSQSLLFDLSSGLGHNPRLRIHPLIR